MAPLGVPTREGSAGAGAGHDTGGETGGGGHTIPMPPQIATSGSGSTSSRSDGVFVRTDRENKSRKGIQVTAYLSSHTNNVG